MSKKIHKLPPITLPSNMDINDAGKKLNKYKPFISLLLRHKNRFLDRCTLQDLIQDIFIKFLRNEKAMSMDFDNKDEMEKYLRTITTCAYIDYYRYERGRKQIRISISSISGSNGYDDTIRNSDDVIYNNIKRSVIIQDINNFDVNLLLNNISKINLTSKEKEILNMLINDYSYTEICDEANLPMGSVKSFIRRIRIKLAKNIDIKHFNCDTFSLKNIQKYSKSI